MDNHLVDDEGGSASMLSNLADTHFGDLLGDRFSLEDLAAVLRSNIDVRPSRFDEIGAVDNTSEVFDQVFIEGDVSSRGRRFEEIADVVHKDLILEEEVVGIIVEVEPVVRALHACAEEHALLG